MKVSGFALALLVAGAFGLATEARAGAGKTYNPVVFAHGMGGYNNILGYDYWGDEYGVFVGDTCNGVFEINCNEDIDVKQRTFVAQVAGFESSEVRGLDLAEDIEGYLATVGKARVNIIGHSQGGIDARKAARVLYERHGYAVVRVLISVSSPHRGSPVAKYILERKAGVTHVLDAMARYFGDTVYLPGNDVYAGAKQLVYDDFDPADEKLTGMRAFNEAYPVDDRYAERYASVITAQHGVNVNPALFLLSQFFFDIDGDGYCDGDCDNDGAWGRGDGVPNEADDDGMVGINSQQMGYRLDYDERTFGFDQVRTDVVHGYVRNLNAPARLQAISASKVVPQDHLDVIGVGPDTFDEPEFYAALIDYISRYDQAARLFPVPSKPPVNDGTPVIRHPAPVMTWLIP
jgi:triacylglycerol lipase